MGDISIFNGVINQKQSPALYQGNFANRPTANFLGRMFTSVDTGQIFVDTGSTWVLVADAGVGGGTLSSVCINGNTTATGITITAGGLNTNAAQVTSLNGDGGIIFTDGSGNLSQDVTNLVWDNTQKYLGIGGTGTPTAALDIHSNTANVQIQLNAVSTNNSTIAFQNASVGKWRVGNLYSSGSNLFHIYNTTLATNAMTIDSSNAAVFVGSLTASSLIKSGGTSSQFLKADGSVDSSAYITLASLSAASPLIYNNGTGQFTIQVANGSQSGYLSSTDWTTFNNKASLGSFSATSPLSYNSGTGAFSIQVANSGQSGYLTSTDWNTFNNKQSTITTGNLTEATSSVLTISGGTGAVIGTGTSIQVKQSSSIQSGYLSSTDWNTFNNKATALNGTGFVKASGTTISYDNSTYYLASNPSNYITLTSLAATSPLVYNNLSGGFSITQATTSTNGYLSSTDWNTFNNKQSALTNPVTGTGTTNYVPKFTAASTIGNSSIQDTGSLITMTSNVTTTGIQNVQNGLNLGYTFGGAVSNYTSVYGKTDGLQLALANGTGGATFILQTAAGYAYTYPAATGTLALTSNLSSYLPLTGGTLTGALNGTSASFSSTVTANGSLNGYQSGTQNLLIDWSASSQITTLTNTELFFGTNAQRRMTISNSGLIGVNTTGLTLLSQFTSYSTTQSNQIKAAGTAPAITFSDATNSVTYGGAVGVATGANNFITGSAAGDMAITNQSAVAGNLLFGIGTSEKMRLNTSGNVGIGITSTDGKLHVNAGTGQNFVVAGDGTNICSINNYSSSNGFQQLKIVGSPLTFYTGTAGTGSVTEVIRITSGGLFKLQNNGSAYESSTVGVNEFNTAANDTNVVFRNTASSLTAARAGIDIYYPNASPNGTTACFYQAADNGGGAGRTTRFEVRSNGGIGNYQANDVNLSDIRVKRDIVPLESYWNKFKAIKIVKFKYKDQTHDDYNIGVIAQQVQEIAPEFIDTDGWGKDDIQNNEQLWSVYTSDIHHATIKVLQEAMDKIEELNDKLVRNNIN